MRQTKAVNIPYHITHMTANVPIDNLIGVLMSTSNSSVVKEESDIVQSSLENPIASKRVSELAKEKKNIVVITSDHTRAMPSGITMPLLLKEIRLFNKEADITILIATGLHRPTTYEELVERFGQEIVDNEKIVVHNAFDDDSIVDLGELPSGNRLELNKLAVEADMIVCEGFIEPHFFAGFSGGRKSILPGIASKDTINTNHCARNLAHPMARTGKLEGNVIHEDMLCAAKAIGVDFILNVAVHDKKITACFSGDLEKAHETGCKYVLDNAKADKRLADIVITGNGGAPLDQNLYQSPKAISTALECIKENGIIIMVCSCSDGVGGDNFQKMMLTKKSPGEKLKDILEMDDKDTIDEQWCAQRLYEVLVNYKLMLVTDMFDHEVLSNMGIMPFNTVDEAIEKSLEIKGEESSILVIPDGVSVII